MMLVLCQKIVICVMTLPPCCMMATVIQQGREQFPVRISLVTIPGTVYEYPSDDNRQDSFNLLRNATHEIIQNTLTNPISQICGPGEWRRVFNLNTSRSDQSCPGGWRLVTSPVRGCTGADYSCSSAFSDNISTAYIKVCDRITGESAVTPDAFLRFISNQGTIEDIYLDGVSITHGASGSRTHIWSFGAGVRVPSVSRCPCDTTDRAGAPLPPAEVGDSYFYDGALQLNRLWTGESCTTDNPCCSFHNPPYFSVQLPASTTDRIEIRLCTDEYFANEPIVVVLAELYVQ